MPANCLSSPSKCPFEEYGFKAVGLRYCNFTGEQNQTNSIKQVLACFQKNFSFSCCRHTFLNVTNLFAVDVQETLQSGQSFEISFVAVASDGGCVNQKRAAAASSMPE